VVFQLLNWPALPCLCLVHIEMDAFCSKLTVSCRATEVMKQTGQRAVLLPEVNLVSGTLILRFYGCKTRPDRINVGLKAPRLGIDKRNGSERNSQNFLSYWAHFCCFIYWNYKSSFITHCGLGSSVGIATGYGLDGPGIESLWGRDFPPVQTGPGAHPTSCTMGTGSFPGVNSGRGVTLTPHLFLAQRS